MIDDKANLSKKIFSSDLAKNSTRAGFGDGLLYLGENNPNVWVLCADLTESVRAQDFAEKYPERFVEMGVAEQNMAGLAAGLALEGKIPFACSFAAFSPGRNWDQIRVSVAYSKANVKIASTHAGLSTGEDGATHQGLEDLAIMRAIPNFTVIEACDAVEAEKATRSAAGINGPVYLRFHRSKVPIITTAKTPFRIGRAETFFDGDDVTIIGSGPILFDALVVAHELEAEGVSVRVINCHTLKPIDEKAIIKAAGETGAFVTVEDHQRSGGLGSAVSEVLARFRPIPVEMIAVDDTFGESGRPADLLAKYGLTKKDIREAVLKVRDRK